MKNHMVPVREATPQASKLMMGIKNLKAFVRKGVGVEGGAETHTTLQQRWLLIPSAARFKTAMLCCPLKSRIKGMIPAAPKPRGL